MQVNKYIYHLKRPERGDVVVLRPPGNKRWRYVKRVIGLGGDTLRIRSGKVYLNDQPLEEPYAVGPTGPNMEPRQVPADSVYVLGDNRLNSEDSRLFGSVSMKSIEGKIKPGRWFSLW